jgi:hypothetical protein
VRVLIACESSARVRDAFRARGHDAWSCDIKPTEGDPQWHIQGSVFDVDVVKGGWDLMIAHPDCTFLTVSGNRWAKEEWRQEARLMALHTVKALWKFPVPRICIENPIGKLASLWHGPDQVIQPWQFWHLGTPGEGEAKATCFWLKDLDPLEPTTPNETGRHQACWLEPPSPERKSNRSRTYLGIADAMADQWGGFGGDYKVGAIEAHRQGGGLITSKSED